MIVSSEAVSDAFNADETPPDESAAHRDADATDNAAETDRGGDGVDDELVLEVRRPRAHISWSRALACGVLPVVAMLLAAGAGWVKWQDSFTRMGDTAGGQAVHAASDSAVALLSYGPDTAEKDLLAAQSRLTGNFRDTYTSLIREVVIPAAKQKRVSALANVPSAALVSATAAHAVVLLAINQTVTVGNDAPSSTASSVRVTLDRIGDRWLISGFDPV